MRILVTGGAGFIGSEFVRQQLASDGTAQITVFDKLTYSGVEANLAPVADHPGYTFVKGDICDADAVDQVMPGHDVVVHFAAESHVDRSIAGAGPFVMTNVVGTQVLLDSARKYGVGRFVHISTDEVYGSIGEGSWTEEWPLVPNSPYSASKASSDLLALAYARTHGMDVVVTRCSNNYGHYQFPEKVIPLFVSNLMDGKKVPLYGNGGNVRDWLHVSDHCRGIDLAMRGAGPARSTTSAAARSSPTRSSPVSCWRPRASVGTWSSTSRTARVTTCATPSTSARSAPNSVTPRRSPSRTASRPPSTGTARTVPGGSRSR